MPWLLEGRFTFSWSVAMHRGDDDKVMAISSDVLGGHNNGIVRGESTGGYSHTGTTNRWILYIVCCLRGGQH